MTVLLNGRQNVNDINLFIHRCFELLKLLKHFFIVSENSCLQTIYFFFDRLANNLFCAFEQVFFIEKSQ